MPCYWRHTCPPGPREARGRQLRTVRERSSRNQPITPLASPGRSTLRMMAAMTMSADFSAIPKAHRPEKIDELCAAMEAAYAAGHYPPLTAERPGPAPNRAPAVESAAPRALRLCALA